MQTGKHIDNRIDVQISQNISLNQQIPSECKNCFTKIQGQYIVNGIKEMKGFYKSLLVQMVTQ